jgi:hypothetical protein
MDIKNVKWIELSAATETDEAVYSGVKATIDGQELFVPKDPANRHYAEIMRQVEAGELTIQEAD